MMRQIAVNLKGIPSKYILVRKFESQEENVLAYHLTADKAVLFSPGSSGEFPSLPFLASTGFGHFLHIQSCGV